MQLKFKNLLFKYEPLMITSRNSTLLLLKMNFLRLANVLYKAGAGDSKSKGYKGMVHIWTSIGGKPSVFIHAIKQGMRVEYKHHKGSHPTSQAVFNYTGEPDNFGPAFAAPIVAAAPIIGKFLSFLKSLGIDTSTIKAGLGKALKSGVKELIESKKGKMITNDDGTTTYEVPQNALIVPNQEKLRISAPLMIAAAVGLFIAFKTLKK